jgi:hypothetical protein
MAFFSGLDVGMDETAICMVDDKGKVALEVTLVTDPDAIKAGTEAVSWPLAAGWPRGRRAVAGAHDLSILWERMSRRGPDQMPPLASDQVDAAGAALLQEWIDGLSGCSVP